MSLPTTALPDLNDEYPLTEEQIAQYRRDGHILLRGVCSAEELEAYRPALVAAVDRYKAKYPPLEERDTYGKAFLQITNLWVEDARAKAFVLARRFAGIAARLMGVEGIRLYHDQALFKEPGGGHTPWHQDQHYWPLLTDNTITMWMPLVEVTADMGVMNFASGSHTTGYLGNLPISDESEAKFREFVRERGFPIAPGVDMAAGDATFHSGWTLHNAPPNRQDRMREVMTVIYYEDGAVLMEPDHTNRQADLEAWFPGQKPGEVAASALNPLLYRA
jgi:ectoine hydroxylase-related dioxygenase (phytanoyl-CoA dioxygenase family)